MGVNIEGLFQTTPDTHQVKTDLHHWAQACPMMEQRNGILDENGLGLEVGKFSHKHTIYRFVGVFGSMQGHLHIGSMRDSVRDHTVHGELGLRR